MRNSNIHITLDYLYIFNKVNTEWKKLFLTCRAKLILEPQSEVEDYVTRYVATGANKILDTHVLGYSRFWPKNITGKPFVLYFSKKQNVSKQKSQKLARLTKNGSSLPCI